MKCKKCATLYSSFCHSWASGGLCGFISSLLMISVDGITNLPMVCFFPNKPTELTAKVAEHGTSRGKNRYSYKCSDCTFCSFDCGPVKSGVPPWKALSHQTMAAPRISGRPQSRTRSLVTKVNLFKPCSGSVLSS